MEMHKALSQCQAPSRPLERGDNCHHPILIWSSLLLCFPRQVLQKQSIVTYSLWTPR